MTDERQYTVGISKGAGLLQPFRRLLVCWEPGMPPSRLAQLAQDSGAFGTQSAYRIDDIVTRVFAPRLLRPDDIPARALRTVVQADLGSAVFCELLMVYSARRDPLLGDFVRDVFWPAAHLGRSSLSLVDALAIIEAGEVAGRMPSPWSDQVKLKVARGLLGALRDFGFVSEAGRTGKPREITKRSVSAHSVFVTAAELRERGLSADDILRSSDWGTLGTEPERVLMEVERVGAGVGVTVQAGGGAVQIAWPNLSMEDLIRATA